MFIEVNKIDASNEKTNVGSSSITIDTSGVGTYSLASPISISAEEGEQVEILVYTNSSKVQLVTRLLVKPVLFEF